MYNKTVRWKHKVKYRPPFYAQDFSGLESWKLDSFKIAKQIKYLPISLWLSRQKYIM
jgi:hypothetical protein